jgi:hypothetical protein
MKLYTPLSHLKPTTTLFFSLRKSYSQHRLNWRGVVLSEVPHQNHNHARGWRTTTLSRWGRSVVVSLTTLGIPGFCRVVLSKEITSEEMVQHRHFLDSHAVVITEEGPHNVYSREEVKDLIQHHLKIHKHEFSIYRSRLKPFIAIFHGTHARDVVFATGKVLDGPIELGFHAWDLDRFGDREIIPYQVRISLEGLPNMLGAMK